MNSKIKVWHLFVSLCVLLVIIRFTTIVGVIWLLGSHFILFINDFHFALNQISFNILDNYFSALLILALPLIVFFKLKTFKVFQAELDFSNFIITLLVFIFIFSPLVSNTHPDFQKNVRVTKLLPPLSKVIYLKFEPMSKQKQSYIDEFVVQKNEAIKSAFDENLIFVDSIRLDDRITFYQNKKVSEISLDSLKAINILPLLNKKFFLLGTDEFGRDIFSRLVYGARVSIFVGLCAVCVAFLIGFLFGFISGYWGGLLDLILNRLSDMFLSFPTIFFIIVILALFGNSMLAVIIVLGLSGWMSLFKIVRGEVISLKQKDFFLTAKLIGLSTKNLLLREVLPIILTPIIVNLVFLFGSVILAEAALSYLGLGVGTNYPSWGGMIDAGQDYLKEAWWMIFFPGFALILTLYAANDVGQKVKIHFNPMLKR